MDNKPVKIKLNVTIEQYINAYAEKVKNKILNNEVKININPESSYNLIKCDYCGSCYPFNETKTIIKNNRLSTYCLNHFNKNMEIEQKSYIQKILEEEIDKFIKNEREKEND